MSELGGGHGSCDRPGDGSGWLFALLVFGGDLHSVVCQPLIEQLAVLKKKKLNKHLKLEYMFGHHHLSLEVKVKCKSNTNYSILKNIPSASSYLHCVKKDLYICLFFYPNWSCDSVGPAVLCHGALHNRWVFWDL